MIEGLQQVNTPKGRYYIKDNIRYPSVTTVLKYYTDKDKSLQQWRDRIGHDEANKIASRAANIGTIAHDLISNNLTKKEEPDIQHEDKDVIMEHYDRISSTLDDRLVSVIGSEFKVFNKIQGMAGTCDLFGEWRFDDGSVRLAIIDFKTKRKSMYLPALQEYGLQCSIYAQGIDVSQTPEDVVIIESAEGANKARCFVSNTWKFYEIMETDKFQNAVKKATEDCYKW